MISDKASYFLWALKNTSQKDTSCPSCGHKDTHQVYRKMLVTLLQECNQCKLRFRLPKDDMNRSTSFYQTDYKQGFTTDLPSTLELEKLKNIEFKGSAKDYTRYIEVIQATGLRSNNSILDFGCSWGYGSWQLTRVGFDVLSYEISRPRAQYAKEYLSCNIIEQLSDLPKQVDCFFSAHVIEHLPNTDVFWTAAKQALHPKGAGIVICIMPNGEPALEDRYGKRRYHRLWGKVHPLLFNGDALRHSAKRHGFTPYLFTSPFDLDAINTFGSNDKLLGEEMLLIAHLES